MLLGFSLLVDGSTSNREYGQRRMIREKYDGQPSTASVNVLMDKYVSLHI